MELIYESDLKGAIQNIDQDQTIDSIGDSQTII